MTQVLDELVGRQFRRWEHGRRSTRAEVTRPSIALSRLPSAGAAELGQRLADQLGYAFFGIELVDHIARRAGLHPELVAGVDEHVRSAIDRYVVDGILNALSAWTLTAGDDVRMIQSGRAQDYVYGVAVGLVVLLIWVQFI